MMLTTSRYIFDLKAAIPYHSMPEAEREEIWDDGLHFTPKGYERMGELVAARLFEIIEAEKAAEGSD
jgi:lysophospholipase L1-like esterase